MALRNARDPYTRRQEGVRSGSCFPPRSPRSARKNGTPSSTPPRTRSIGTRPSTMSRPRWRPVTVTLVRSGFRPAPGVAECLLLGGRRADHAPAADGVVAWAPQFEEDMALGNIGLDLIGQARALLSRAGELSARRAPGRTPRTISPTWREERRLHQVQLVEQDRGDFARDHRGAPRSVHLAVPTCTPRWRHSPSAHRRRGGQGREGGRPTTRTTPGVDVSARRGTEVSRANLCSAALAAVAPYVPPALRRRRSWSKPLPPKGLPSCPHLSASRVGASITAVLAEAALDWPEVGWRSRGGRQGLHSTAHGTPAGRDAVSGPARIGRIVVTITGRQRADRADGTGRRTPLGGGRAGPRAAGADARPARRHPRCAPGVGPRRVDPRRRRHHARPTPAARRWR